MKISPTFKFQFKRRKEGKTDYKRRMKLLNSGKSRLVVRRSNNYIQVQIVNFDEKGDKTLFSSNSKSLKKLGWNFSCDNISAAYLTGIKIGKEALKNNIKEVILDLGLYSSTKGNRIYSVVKGVIDAGLKIPVNENILPSNERIAGNHIASFNSKFKNLPNKFEEVKKILIEGVNK